MPLPHSFKQLEQQVLKGPFLDELVSRLEQLRDDGNKEANEKKTNGGAQRAMIFDYILRRVKQQPGGISTSTMHEFQETYFNADKPIELDFLGETEIPVFIGDNGMAILIHMGVHGHSSIAFYECLSLQDGWHKELISFYMQSNDMLDAKNYSEFIKQRASSEKKEKRSPDPEHHAYNYLELMRDYLALPGTSEDDVSSPQKFFDKDYADNPEPGMSHIFTLARIVYHHSNLIADCAQEGIQMNAVLAYMSKKYDFPFPPSIAAQITPEDYSYAPKRPQKSEFPFFVEPPAIDKCRLN